MSYPPFLIRTAMLLGDEGLEKLSNAKVAVIGLGGVGGGAVEALSRIGIGHLYLVDADTFSESNLNRQILSTTANIGKDKADEAKKRALLINPDIEVEAVKEFILPDNDQTPYATFSFLIDAVDTLKTKVHLAKKCLEFGVPEAVCLGMGNRLDPSKIKMGDLFETAGDPLAKTMRKQCRMVGISSLPVVYSLEEPIKPRFKIEQEPDLRRDIPGSAAFVPPVAGYYLAYMAVKAILGK